MLQLKNIHQSYPGSLEPILRGLNLELYQGDFCVVIGSNGSGKSTLIRAILGETRIDSGNIMINGNDLSNQDRSHLIASVAQDINKGTIPELTLIENMALSAIRAQGARFNLYQHYEKQARALTKTLNAGLESDINTPLSCLSGGQRQMVATLMAISSSPQILLLDEHTSALDPKMQQVLMEYTTKAITQQNMTTLMVTHNLDDALKYGNRLIMLHQGTIVVDVKHDEKAQLTKTDLLHLFNHYESYAYSDVKEKHHEH